MSGPNTTQFDIGAILTAPTKDPDWLKKCLIMGLLTMIPLVGSFNLSGWMKAIADKRIAGGDDLLPEAGLNYIGGGWRLVVAWLPLMGLMMVMSTGLVGVAVAAIVAGGKGAGEAIGFSIIAIMYVGMLAFSLVISMVAPAINFLHVVDGDGWASISFRRQWETIRTGGMQYLLLFFGIMVAGIIGQLGLFALGVGIFITIPFAQAVNGFALAEFARVVRPQGNERFDGSAGGASGAPFGVKI